MYFFVGDRDLAGLLAMLTQGSTLAHHYLQMINFDEVEFSNSFF